MRNQADPRHVYANGNFRDLIEPEIQVNLDGADLLNSGFENSFGRFKKFGGWFSNFFTLGRDFYGVAFHIVTNYANFKDYCKQNYTPKPGMLEKNFWHECAVSHFNHKHDTEGTGQEYYWDFHDTDRTWNFVFIHENFQKLCIGLGLIFNLAGVKIHRSYVVWTLFIVNFIFSLPQPWRLRPYLQYGVDYAAYLQQAYAVYMGERNYGRISSSQGACYYPAGHLWHYQPAIWLHLNSDHALVIMKLVHALMHQITLVTVVKICYVYFAERDDSKEEGVDYDKSSRAQLIAFIMLSSNRDREYFSDMYNDQIMVMYLALCIYAFVKNRPL